MLLGVAFAALALGYALGLKAGRMQGLLIAKAIEDVSCMEMPCEASVPDEFVAVQRRAGQEGSQ
jgi:hypothetical protein